MLYEYNKCKHLRSWCNQFSTPFVLFDVKISHTLHPSYSEQKSL